MMYDQVLSNPGGGDLQDRIENYFLAWSNSIRRDLEALGVLDTPSGYDGLLSIHPADMTDEQLDAAIALIQRRQPVCSDAEVKWSDDIDAVELEIPASWPQADTGL
jgi:hypothetical protein